MVGVMPLGRFLTVVVSLNMVLWPRLLLRVKVVVVVTLVMTVLVEEFTFCVRGTPPRVRRTNLMCFRLKARYVWWNAEIIRRALLCGRALLFLFLTTIRVVAPIGLVSSANLSLLRQLKVKLIALKLELRPVSAVGIPICIPWAIGATLCCFLLYSYHKLSIAHCGSVRAKP